MNAEHMVRRGVLAIALPVCSPVVRMPRARIRLRNSRTLDDRKTFER